MTNFNSKLLINCVLGFVSIVGIFQLQSKHLSHKILAQNEDLSIRQEKQHQIQANFQKKLPSFGFSNLIADWSYLQFLQYFGDADARAVTGYSVVTDYFEAIVERDPNFLDSHFIISPANSLFAAQPEKTINLIEQALESVTVDSPGYPFFLWTYKATDEILFLGDLAAASQSYRKAAKWAKLRQDELGDELSERFNQTAAFLDTNPDPTKARIGAWMNVLSTAKDKQTFQYVVEKLKELGVEVTISEQGQLIIKHQDEV